MKIAKTASICSVVISGDVEESMLCRGVLNLIACKNPSVPLASAQHTAHAEPWACKLCLASWCVGKQQHFQCNPKLSGNQHHDSPCRQAAYPLRLYNDSTVATILKTLPYVLSRESSQYQPLYATCPTQ